MERKLAIYRAKKSMETYLSEFKSKISKLGEHSTETEPDHIESNVENEKLLESDDNNEENHDLETPTPEAANQGYSKLTYILIFSFWLGLYYFFIRLEFGLVYLIVSCIVGICLNTRTGSKKAGEVSAYSVFNQNCEAIDGSIKLEQFEREMGYRVR